LHRLSCATSPEIEKRQLNVNKILKEGTLGEASPPFFIRTKKLLVKSVEMIPDTVLAGNINKQDGLKLMRRLISLVGILSVFLFSIAGCTSIVRRPELFTEDFEKGRLDLLRWEVTSDGDFAEAIVDVIDVASGEETDFRLRLRANTVGTSDPLKYLGLKSKNTVHFDTAKAILFDLDWNKQTNGSYLTASFYLCPIKSDNPKEESDWLKFEYVGVPPGRNVRINILAKADGVIYPLHVDWGPRSDNGRPLGKPLGLSSHRISLFLDKSRMRVVQDDEEIFPLTKHNLNFTTAYIYLQMSSGTNYPSREIYFDNIIVRSPSSDWKLP